jgi:CelD/BcsL family acetyltransferase involved in cellulose biosynthesis
MSLRVAMHQESSIFQELAPEWDELLHRSVTDVIFLTVEWQSTWWESYNAGELLIFTCRDERDRLLGIAPWFIHDLRGERVVRTIGCVDVTDYVDVIVDKAFLQPVLACFAAVLNENSAKFDRINFCNIPEASPTLSVFPELLRSCQFEVDVVLQEVCPVIALPATWDAYLESLDKKQRHEIRRKLRRAESEVDLEIEALTAPADVNTKIDTFLHLMASSQPAKAEFLRDAGNARFFRSIVQAVSERGWLRMSFLKVNGEPAAAYCDFIYRGKVLVYNSGLLIDKYAHLSTGIVLLAQNIRWAIENGYQVFDFLRGNETYKYRMGGQDTRVFKLMARKLN